MAEQSAPPPGSSPDGRERRQQIEAVLVDAEDPRVIEELRERTLQGPDGDEEHLFVPLEDENPELADELKRRFVERWLVEARLPLHRFQDALDTVELKIAPDKPQNRWRLRLRSFYTGTTYWLYEWDRLRQLAETWIDQMAADQGANVNYDRKHGPTPWDEHRWGTPRT